MTFSAAADRVKTLSMPPAPGLGTITAVHIGKVALLGPKAVLSGFVKHRVDGAVAVTVRGLLGDEVADHSVHGGMDKAVYGYATAHYPAWRAEFPQHESLLIPGGFGENLAIEGIDEAGLCLGDEVAIGTARLGLSQPRQPCSKLALRFDKHMGRAMTHSGRAGWYYRVLQPGTIAAGDAMRLLARPNPDWSFARFLHQLREKSFSDQDLTELAELPGLADQWRRDSRKTLDRRAQARATVQRAAASHG